jgi:hypothetical protein
MPSKMAQFLFFATAFQICLPAIAQDKAASDRLSFAHSQYYTPTASGLESFQCDASIDWKTMLTRFSGKDIAEDNPFLKQLQTVHLTVSDDIHGKGSLNWTRTEDPPKSMEGPLKQIQDGMETTIAGFFQSRNAYMNGSMVPLPDSTLTVTTVADGIHMSGTSNNMTIDEDFDKNMLLTQVLVVGSDSKVRAVPTYEDTPDGRRVSAIRSQINQPPSAPQTEVNITMEYAKVGAFQIPSPVVFDIKNTGTIEVGFRACQVSVADWAKKP